MGSPFFSTSQALNGTLLTLLLWHKSLQCGLGDFVQRHLNLTGHLLQFLHLEPGPLSLTARRLVLRLASDEPFCVGSRAGPARCLLQLQTPMLWHNFRPWGLDSGPLLLLISMDLLLVTVAIVRRSPYKREKQNKKTQETGTF